MKKLLIAAATLAAIGTTAVAYDNCDSYKIKDDGSWANVYQLPGDPHTYHVMMTKTFFPNWTEVSNSIGDVATAYAAGYAVSSVCGDGGSIEKDPNWNLDGIQDVGDYLWGYVSLDYDIEEDE